MRARRGVRLLTSRRGSKGARRGDGDLASNARAGGRGGGSGQQTHGRSCELRHCVCLCVCRRRGGNQQTKDEVNRVESNYEGERGELRALIQSRRQENGGMPALEHARHTQAYFAVARARRIQRRMLG